MTAFLAGARLGLRALLRHPPILAAAIAALLLAGLAPRLVAFAFAEGDALSIEAALGTATLAGPLLVLFGSLALGSEDDPARRLRPLLVAPAPLPTVLSGLVTGCAAAGTLIVTLGTILSSASLAAHGIHASPASLLLAALASSMACLPAAATGLLLAVAAPRVLAAALAALAAVAAFAAPTLLPPVASTFVPSSDTLLLSRDAAFGSVSVAAVASSTMASLLLAAAALGATVTWLRLKGQCPDPGIHRAPSTQST
ncbi:MAG: hypothetical protein ACYTDX_00325 [Planctomycetota bacterium]|jgi:hypothetical protein